VCRDIYKVRLSDHPACLSEDIHNVLTPPSPFFLFRGDYVVLLVNPGMVQLSVDPLWRSAKAGHMDFPCSLVSPSLFSLLTAL